MNKEQIKNVKIQSPEVFWSVNHKGYDTMIVSQTDQVKFDRKDFFRFMKAYSDYILESKREEIERKAYEAGMTEMFYSFRYNTGVKEITKDFINKRFDQWKESQNQEQ